MMPITFGRKILTKHLNGCEEYQMVVIMAPAQDTEYTQSWFMRSHGQTKYSVQ